MKKYIKSKLKYSKCIKAKILTVYWLITGLREGNIDRVKKMKSKHSHTLTSYSICGGFVKCQRKTHYWLNHISSNDVDSMLWHAFHEVVFFFNSFSQTLILKYSPEWVEFSGHQS